MGVLAWGGGRARGACAACAASRCGFESIRSVREFREYQRPVANLGLGLALGGLALHVESRVLPHHPLAPAAPWAFRWFGRDHHTVLGALACVGWTSARWWPARPGTGASTPIPNTPARERQIEMRIGSSAEPRDGAAWSGRDGRAGAQYHSQRGLSTHHVRIWRQACRSREILVI